MPEFDSRLRLHLTSASGSRAEFPKLSLRVQFSPGVPWGVNLAGTRDGLLSRSPLLGVSFDYSALRRYTQEMEPNPHLLGLNDEAKIAWLAGLFDADGTLVFGGREKQRTYISIEMTDLDIIVQCERMFGGSVYGPYHKNQGHNVLPIYQWRCQRQKEAWNLLDSIYPLLSIRRRAKIDECRERRDNFVSLR